MSVLPSREPQAVAQRAVREAAVFTVFVIVLRLIFGVSLLINPLPGATRWLYVCSLLDCGLLAGLAYGVYRMSRVCTVLLLAFFVADQFLKVYFQVFVRGGMADLILVIGCIFLSIRAIVACLRCHSLRRQKTHEPANAEPLSSPSGQ